MRPCDRRPAPRAARGFTYLGLLMFVALTGAGLAALGELWQTTAQREREAELLFIGQQFSQALASFAAAASDGRRNPKSLDELLEDRRLPAVQRHLRKVFVDPFTGRADWGLVRAPDGSILGVHSLSTLEPFRTQPPSATGEAVAAARSYREWVFAAARPSADTPPAGATAAQAGQPAGPAAGGAPAAAGVPPAVPADPAPGVPPARDDPRARDETCRQLREEEYLTCGARVARLGRAAEQRCMASADARFAVCASGSGLVPPPLYYGNELLESSR